MSGIPNTRPYFPNQMAEDIARDIAALLSSGQLMMGPYQDRAEAGFAQSVGTSYAVSLNSGTTGLQIALRYAKCRGRDVLVPAASFVTDLGAVLMEGGNPILIDCDPETLAVDPVDLRTKMTKNTTALIWVHLTGYISDQYLEIQAFARENRLLLIEDSSHAHGARIDGHRAGSLGNVGIFSMYPTKVLTSGTGGFLTTDDSDLAKFARELRNFGKEEATGEILHLGNDWFMDEIRACVASHQIEALEEISARRVRAAQCYTERLSNRHRFRVFHPRDGHRPGWYQYPVLFQDSAMADAAIVALKSKEIYCKKIYRPPHEEKVFADLPTPNIEKACDFLNRAVCLPMMTDISEEEIDTVCDALLDFCNSYRA